MTTESPPSEAARDPDITSSTRVAHRPREVAAVVRRERRANNCQDAAEQAVVHPQAIHVRAGKRLELNEWHSVCVLQKHRARVEP
jgi:hypothetical protein